MLFSEPKIPQRKKLNRVPIERTIVSVLFSEPKIPQLIRRTAYDHNPVRFSALQRAENSSTIDAPPIPVDKRGFSALQRAENSSTHVHFVTPRIIAFVSVLFSEPKIPQPYSAEGNRTPRPAFQCSSASRKFLNPCVPSARRSGTCAFQCSSASRKFLDPAMVGALLSW